MKMVAITRLPKHRAGAVALESAFVLPVMFLLLFSLIVGGMGVFRYQQVACLAREAARWTCVRGTEWAAETGKATPTKDEILQAVASHKAGMSPSALALDVTWVDGASSAEVPWDESSKNPRSLNASNEIVANRIRVTVTYEWSPRVLWFGSMRLRSVSEMPMQF